MSMSKGEATGPQKRPRRTTQAAAAPVTEEALDGPLDPDAEVVRGDDDSRARAAWDAVVQRTAEEAQRVLDALENLPAGDLVRKPDTMPLEEMREVEGNLTKLRVILEQTGDLVQ